MRTRVLRFALLGLPVVAACASEPDPGSAAGQAASREETVIRRSEAGSGTLTGPSNDSPEALGVAFLAGQGVTADQLAVTSKVSGRTGVTHLRIGQTVGGLRVHGAYAKIAVSARGEIIQSIERIARASGRIAPARRSAWDALRAAMTEHGYTETPGIESGVGGNVTSFGATSELFRAPTVERVAFVGGDGALRAGFLVETWSKRGNQLDYTLVDGDGAVVSVERRTQNDRYNVFTEDPSSGPQVVVSGPGAGNAESPTGWLGTRPQTTLNIGGNNTNAYLDRDTNNSADSGGSAITAGDFLSVADLAVSPQLGANREVAVQNLFFLTNVVHDTLYRHGFDEAAGNFQIDNFGRGGAGNDPVLAEAQDGSGIDNANFSTPNDGSSPRMQMYLWTGGGGATALVRSGDKSFAAYPSSFGPALTENPTTGQLAVYENASGIGSDACETSRGSLAGKVALVDRGTCNFTTKVMNAQKAGAVAVIIVNNVDGGASSPGGTERRVKIPSAMVSKVDGSALKSLAAGSAVDLLKNPILPLQIDAALDSDVVFHEYGHGLTWRMIGGMTGPLAGAVGEGASDVTAFLINGDDRIGEYASSSPFGIRRNPYGEYPLTYAAVTGGEVHNDGEIYAAAMWRVLQNYLAVGLTADALMGDFVDGMNYTPSSPAFEHMRDGLLMAVAGTGRECLVWRGFAATGIGVGAAGKATRRGVSITESFVLPAQCQ